LALAERKINPDLRAQWISIIVATMRTSTNGRPFIHMAANDSFSVAGYSGVDAIFVNTSAFGLSR